MKGLSGLLVAQVAGFSAGCVAPALGPGRRQAQVVQVGAALRHFSVTVPAGFAVEPKPVLFAYHGYTGSSDEIADEHHFDELAEQRGFLVVYADGMRDGPQGGSWNVGSQGPETCDRPQFAACYDSCKAGGCGACAWSTCADDLAFADALVAQLATEACVDLTRLYLYGESAGAMLVYRLLRERPGVYAAAAPEQGLPYRGQGSRGALPAILHLHDRQDKVVPVQGGRADDGWVYESLGATLQQVCGGLSKAAYDTRLPKVECTQYLGCRGGPVVSCLYDGEHGDLPDGLRRVDGAEQAGLSDEFILDFLQEHRTHLPEVEQSRWGPAQWERLALAGLLAAAVLSGVALLREHRRKDEEKALLGH